MLAPSVRCTMFPPSVGLVRDVSIRELDALLVVVGSIIGHSAAAGGHAGG